MSRSGAKRGVKMGLRALSDGLCRSSPPQDNYAGGQIISGDWGVRSSASIAERGVWPETLMGYRFSLGFVRPFYFQEQLASTNLGL